jgi:hypothetical protein
MIKPRRNSTSTAVLILKPFLPVPASTPTPQKSPAPSVAAG